jgi:hypothetical protein
MTRTVDREGRVAVEWTLDTGDVIDPDYVASHRHELVDASSLRISPARFDEVRTFRQVLVPTLRKISFSFLEVGAVAGNLRAFSPTATLEALSLLKNLKHLSDLDLPWCYAIDDAGAAEIASLTQLEVLALESEMTDQGLERLGALTNLRVFDATCSTHFTGSGFQGWRQMPHLRAIVLSQCTEVGDPALAIVPKAPELDYLVLNGCSKLTAQGLSQLKGGPKLDSLELRGLELDLDTIRALRRNNPIARLGCDVERLPLASRAEAEALLEP